jgi:hypothetical protein
MIIDMILAVAALLATAYVFNVAGHLITKKYN